MWIVDAGLMRSDISVVNETSEREKHESYEGKVHHGKRLKAVKV